MIVKLSYLVGTEQLSFNFEINEYFKYFDAMNKKNGFDENSTIDEHD